MVLSLMADPRDDGDRAIPMTEPRDAGGRVPWQASQAPTLPCLLPQQKQGIFLSRASSISLTVEHALESFSFLNTSDMEDSEGSEEEPLQDERCTAGLVGWGAGWDVALGQLGWGMPGFARVPVCVQPITAPGRSGSRSSRIWPFSGGTMPPCVSRRGLGWEAAPVPWDLLLHPDAGIL